MRRVRTRNFTVHGFELVPKIPEKSGFTQIFANFANFCCKIHVSWEFRGFNVDFFVFTNLMKHGFWDTQFFSGTKKMCKCEFGLYAFNTNKVDFSIPGSLPILGRFVRSRKCIRWNSFLESGVKSMYFGTFNRWSLIVWKFWMSTRSTKTKRYKRQRKFRLKNEGFGFD